MLAIIDRMTKLFEGGVYLGKNEHFSIMENLATAAAQHLTNTSTQYKQQMAVGEANCL